MRVDRRELAAIFVGGFIGALARAGLVEALPPTPGAVAVGDVHRQHRRRVRARLLHDAPAGAPAAVGLPPAVARHRVLRRADDVLDDAGRAAARCSTPATAASRAGYAAASVAAGFLAVAVATNLVRRARLARVSVARRGRRRAARRRGRDRALPARRRGRLRASARAFPFGHARGQPQRRVRARRARRRRASAATRCGSPAPGCSAPTRRSARGCSRRHRLGEDGQPAPRRWPTSLRQPRARARAPSGWAASWERRCERTTPQAHDLLRRARPRAAAASSPTRCVDVYARHAAARRACVLRGGDGLRRQAAPAHRPAADAVRGPAARRRSPSTRRARIEAALADVARAAGDGLVTLERARMLTGRSAVEPPERDGGQAHRLRRPPASAPAGVPAYEAVVDAAAPPRGRRRHRAARRRRHRPRRAPARALLRPQRAACR